MKLAMVAILFTLAGCTDLSEDEKSLIGRWEWSFQSENYREVGYVVLNSNRTHSFQFSSANPTEEIGQEQLESGGYWRLKDGRLCLAVEWNGGNIFKSVNVDKEVCHWDLIRNSNQILLMFKSGLKTEGIVASRT